MAKSRTANRGWRSRMNKYLDSNPDVQAQANARRAQRLESQASLISEAQDALTQQASFIQDEIARLSGSETPDPEAQQ